MTKKITESETELAIKKSYFNILNDLMEDIGLYKIDKKKENLLTKELFVLRMKSAKITEINKITNQKRNEFIFLELIDYKFWEDDTLDDFLIVDDIQNIDDYFYHTMTIDEIVKELLFFDEKGYLLFKDKKVIPDVYLEKKPKLKSLSEYYQIKKEFS